MGPPSITVDQFSQLVGMLYDASLDPQYWQRALMRMRELFAADTVTLILRPPGPDVLGLMVIASENAVEYYSPDYRTSPFTGMTPDKVVTVEDILSVTEWRRHPYYQSWCAPHNTFHVMAVDIRTSDHAIFPLRFTRSEEAVRFSLEDRQRCEQILPHLRRALHFSSQLDSSESLRALYAQALGRLSVATIVLDKTGHIVQMNPAAEQLLDERDGLRVAAGKLEASYAADNRALLAAIRKAIAGQGQSGLAINDAMSLSRPSGKVSLGLLVQRVPMLDWSCGDDQPAAIVFVRDAESKTQVPNRIIQQLFNLTMAETNLAVELANGLSLEEAAEVLGIRHNTARAHLRSIFSKTGVRRQMELVRIVLNCVGALGQTPKRNED